MITSYSGRPLSQHERYALARTQLGFSQCITFVAEYPSVSAVPTVDRLDERLAKLQALWPHLSARITDEKTTCPRWIAGEPWARRDLINEVEINADSLEVVLKRELDDFRRSVSFDKPLFRLTRYTTPGPAYLGCSIAHELVDGRGALRLLNAILAPDVDGLVAEPASPLPLEETVNVRSPILAILALALRKLVLPRLPTFIASFFPEDSVWPGPVVRSPIDCEDKLSLIRLDPKLLDKLSTARQKYPIPPSIHSIITTAYTLALIHVAGDRSLTYTADAPRSERRQDLGHSNILGNYVSSLSFPFTPALLAEHAGSFWALASAVGTRLASPAAKQEALQAVGMLSYMPNSETVDGVTSWERFLLAEAMGPKPYPHSWELSNLGITKLPPGASDMAWCQPGMILSGAIETSALRHAGGMRISVTWRDGSAVDEATVAKVERVFLRVLDRAADGGQSLADLTLE